MGLRPIDTRHSSDTLLCAAACKQIVAKYINLFKRWHEAQIFCLRIEDPHTVLNPVKLYN